MKLTFHGAAREVTGSCHQVEVQDANGKTHQYLFDCGMFQGEHMCGSKNKDHFKFDPAMIEAVFVSHPHADHTGRLAKIVSEGFRGPIYMVEPCVGLSKLVLEDAHHIMKEEAEKCGSEMLYEMEDVNRAFEQVKAVSYHEHLQVAPGIVVMFHEAGHVLGSAYISIDAPADAYALAGREGKRLVYSGDIGNDNVPILPDTEPMSHADVVICESTYGHREHEPIEQRSRLLKEAIVHIIHDRGVLMIPAFSIERTQELLYEIDQLLQKDLKTKIPIFLDSPMAIRATELYRQYQNYLKFDAPLVAQPDRDFFSFPNLRETFSREESKTINDTTPPMIIIAGSGMMSGGRIMHHLRRYLPDHKNRLLIIGYVAKGTLGRRIYEGAKQVKIFGDDIPVHAHVSAIGAFSAHGDMNKLTRWLRPEDGKVPKKIFLVHGDPEAKEVFATHLRHTFGTEVVIPEYQSTYEA
ncbi:MBL fold metallo-hydrolase [Candidatus Uhrbacteria bacterium]|nr:MBL fold metallo-hydrolase [Candidatus Uhrbacteria bacterium]